MEAPSVHWDRVPLPWPHDSEWFYRAQFCIDCYSTFILAGGQRRRFKVVLKDEGQCDVAGCHHKAVRKEVIPTSTYGVVTE